MLLANLNLAPGVLVRLRNRYIAGLLLGMLVWFLPIVVHAQYSYSNNIDGTITITGYSGSGGMVTIPSAINGKRVISLGYRAFYNNTTLTNVLIPDSVTNIGDDAFFSCQNLTNVTIGNNVSFIGYEAFANCFLLAKVYFNGNAPSSPGDTFDSDTLNNPIAYYLPGTTGWGASYFGITTALWVPFTYTTNNSVITITGYTGPGGPVTIPSTIPVNNNSLPVTSIGNGAFGICTNLTSVTIPNSVTNIAAWAFVSCINLRSVTIPNSVTSIGDHAFFDCDGLMSVTIPNSVTSIGVEVFCYCIGLTSIMIPNSVTNIGDNAFYDCASLTSVTLPNSVTSIGGFAFALCTNLMSVTIPNSVTSIGEWVFQDCTSLTNVTIPNSVTNIGEWAFSNCASLTSVTLPNSVTSIGDYAFYYCTSLRSVTIPNSVTSIGGNAFAYCIELTSITIPNSVTNIVGATFYGCTSLSNVCFEGNAPYDGGYTFVYDPVSTIYYINGTVGWGATYDGIPTASCAQCGLWSSIQFTATPTNGGVPLTVHFNCPNVDSGGSVIASWNWSFGDGATSTGQNPTHVYTTVGTFSPTLIATDSLGLTIAGSGPSTVAALPAGQVLNGGFETGDFTGWTLIDSSESTFVDNGSQSGIIPHSGNYDAALRGMSSIAFLSQTVPTVPGQGYLLSFWLNIPDGQTSNEFFVTWNGQTNFEQVNIPAMGWTNMVFVVTATGPSTLLQFGFRDDPSYLGLDDISLVPVPLPNVTNIQLSGANLVINGSNGLSGITYSVLTSTNLALPLNQWRPLATNILNTSGSFSITATNAVNLDVPQCFFILQVR